jgi:hypothetical protein
MITFVEGPHGEKITKAQEKKLRDALSPDSFAWQLNTVYNNIVHFSSHNNYDALGFLTDLKNLIEHKHHTVQVMGGSHTDSYGHTSGMIGQMTPYGEFIPAVVKDTYIRFKVIMDLNHFKILRAIDHFSVFHYLLEVPIVEKLHLHPSNPIVMYELPDASLAPRSRYARSQIVFIPPQ